jgi:hypothetical protein
MGFFGCSCSITKSEIWYGSPCIKPGRLNFPDIPFWLCSSLFASSFLLLQVFFFFFCYIEFCLWLCYLSFRSIFYSFSPWLPLSPPRYSINCSEQSRKREATTVMKEHKLKRCLFAANLQSQEMPEFIFSLKERGGYHLFFLSSWQEGLSPCCFCNALTVMGGTFVNHHLILDSQISEYKNCILTKDLDIFKNFYKQFFTGKFLNKT